MEGWAEFLGDMQQYYDVELDCLSDDYRKEQNDYCLKTGQWTDVHPSQMMGRPAVIKEYDLKTLSLEELKAPLEAECMMTMVDAGPVEGFAGGWGAMWRWCGLVAAVLWVAAVAVLWSLWMQGCVLCAHMALPRVMSS